MATAGRAGRGATEGTARATVEGSSSTLASQVLIAQATSAQKRRAHHGSTSATSGLVTVFCRASLCCRNEGPGAHGHRPPAAGETRGGDGYRWHHGHPGPRCPSETPILSPVPKRPPGY